MATLGYNAVSAHTPKCYAKALDNFRKELDVLRSGLKENNYLRWEMVQSGVCGMDIFCIFNVYSQYDDDDDFGG